MLVDYSVDDDTLVTRKWHKEKIIIEKSGHNMEFVFDGYCGVYCGACPNILATLAGELEEEKQCHGCKSENPTNYCKTCEIKACAINKSLDLCFQCAELSTCGLFQKFVSDPIYPYGQCVEKNMMMIKEISREKWLEAQDKRWRCKNCGTTHSWYEQSCPNCKKFVEDYKADL